VIALIVNIDRAVRFLSCFVIRIRVELHSLTLALVAEQFSAANPSEVRFVKDVEGPAADDSVELTVLLRQASEKLLLLFVLDVLLKKVLTELTLLDWEELRKVKPISV